MFYAWQHEGFSCPLLTSDAKYEEVYIKGYQVPRDAQTGLGEYFPFYNNRRYHQALAYKTPHEVHYGFHGRN
jgi:putative transposase